MVFKKKPAIEEDLPSEEDETLEDIEKEIDAPPAVDEEGGLPMEFICLHCCPVSIVLESEQQSETRGGLHNPGVRIVPGIFGGHKDVRIIRVKMLNCCNRPNSKKTFEEAARLIMDSKHFNGDCPVIIPMEEWNDRKLLDVRKAEMLKKVDEKFEAERRAKYGKRGSAPQG